VKIAMVVNSDPANDTRVKKEARSLTAAGHAVTVFGVRWPGKAPTVGDVGFPIVRPAMPAWVDARGPFNTLRKTAAWYERMRPLVDAAMATSPDVLHAHDLDTVGPASEAARARGVPCVFDDHEASYVDKLPNYAPADARGVKRLALAAITRHVQRRGETLERAVRGRGLAAMITVSDSLADRLVSRFGGERPVVVRNCPLLRDEPRTDALREKLGLGRDAKLLVFHGSVTEGSGIETVIRAMRALPTEYVFALIGRVWGQDRYEALARDEGVADRVRIVPFVPEAEMFRLVASADATVIPTEPNCVGHEFGIPNKLFESLMIGLPVVASDVPEVAAILRRTGAGVTYPAGTPADPGALASAVLRLCGDRAFWDRCRAAGLAAARDELNWERESKKLVAVYGRLA
jgi:glycosyltransferase involved in cell wall biosynthesis